MSDLIAAVFDDAHTAFLARAALARMQGELSLSVQELAVVTRAEEGEIALQEAIGLNREPEMHPTFWKTLVSLLFAAGPSTGGGEGATSAKLTAIGIDGKFQSRLAEHLRYETSALLVLGTGRAIRDRVVGVFRGFQGEIMVAELTGDDREVLLGTLLGTEQVKQMT